MKEWKIRQQYFSMVNGDAEYKDDLRDVKINLVEDEDIITRSDSPLRRICR